MFLTFDLENSGNDTGLVGITELWGSSLKDPGKCAKNKFKSWFERIMQWEIFW